MTVVGVPFILAVGMSAVDGYRSRGRRAKPFPTLPPTSTPLGNGELTTYSFGADLYEDMLAAIDNAEHEILLETYIWKGDELGETFKKALIAAADRGVDVRVIYDSMANLVVPRRFKRFPSSVKVLRFPLYPAGWRFFDFSRYGRDHRKILVVDSNVGFVGGYNIGGLYATEWRDTHVRIAGLGVSDLRRTFVDFWNLNRNRKLPGQERAMQVDTPSEWDPRIRFHRNVPRLWMFPIRSMYMEAIHRASTRIFLTTAYFLPDQDFVDALKDAAERGVDVRILVPLKSNHIVTDWVARGYYSQLLESGIRILRYSGAMIHAKTCTIDGTWSTVGTANIDRMSLTGNYEINVEVIDEEFAQVLEAIFETDESNSLELTESEWTARDVHRKFTEFVLSPLRPLL